MNNDFSDNSGEQGGQGPEESPDIDRRAFVKVGVGTMAALAATASVMEPLRHLENGLDLETFFQDHYRRLTPVLLEDVLTRIEDDIAHKVTIQVGARSLHTVEILSGLDEGDSIIISSTELFSDSDTVLITN